MGRTEGTRGVCDEQSGSQIVWCEDYGEVQRCIAEVQQKGYDREFGRRAANYPT